MTKDQIIKQACVLTLGSGWDCYLFARDIKGADIEELQDRINKLKEI